MKSWVVIWSLLATQLVRQPTADVRVSGGWLRGQVARDGSHLRYTGIPYATYENRFQTSHSNVSWEGVLDAIEEHIRCSQRFTETMILGTEDCLTLNIYTPLQTGKKLKPVMVYIHGGGFRDGSGSPFLYGPEYLVKHDVILVTFNYRLEILGFLCLGIKEAPGNVGLKDQVQALNWVKNNIRVFGGDPDDVTLFGESAGSASVLYHVVSPMSKGLFQRAIMQSGSAISPWSLQFEPIKTAKLLANQMGYNLSDPYKLYELFKNKPVKELLSTRVPRNGGDVVLSENIFVPCIEKTIPGTDQFLPDSPYNLITKGTYSKLPIVIGYNNAEGYMFVGKENDTTISNFNTYGSLPRDLLFHTDLEKKETAEEFKKLYFNKDDKGKDMLMKLSKYEGDAGIVYPVTMTAELLAKAMDHPVYMYKFCRDGRMNLIKTFFRFGNYPGATHADDLFYIFKFAVTLPHSFLEKNMINIMTTMWTNFAKYGLPTPGETQLIAIKWHPLDVKKPELLVIDQEFSTEPLWKDSDLRFWNKTYTKYRRKT
ncbi:cholinesterase 2 [Bicyclus anynana]|uniref:Carboxylic ester hydrolase n=1 Tax=Bicyclus anynana TaxID=110368 RepID=A0A6J1N9C8_BICAN|nr:cholinesterase 2 [Bicyclus anynana]